MKTKTKTQKDITLGFLVLISFITSLVFFSILVSEHHQIKNKLMGAEFTCIEEEIRTEYQVIPPDLRCQLESCNTWAGENCMGYYLPDYEDCMLTAEPLIQNRNVTVCAKEALTKEPQPGILVVPGGYIK